MRSQLSGARSLRGGKDLPNLASVGVPSWLLNYKHRKGSRTGGAEKSSTTQTRLVNASGDTGPFSPPSAVIKIKPRGAEQVFV